MILGEKNKQEPTPKSHWMSVKFALEMAKVDFLPRIFGQYGAEWILLADITELTETNILILKWVILGVTLNWTLKYRKIIFFKLSINSDKLQITIPITVLKL